MIAGHIRPCATLGLFLCLLAVYVLTNAGRIDIIDGQIRYDVAANWLDTGHPLLRDPFLTGGSFAVRTVHGTFGVYNAGGSVTAMPAMLVSRLLPGHSVERDRFVFSMIGPVFGAGVGALLVFAYGMLGLSHTASLAWAATISLTTLWWPGSVTVFDQNQHAFFLLTSVVLAWQSGRQKRLWLAGLAGLAGGLLITYQETYALLLPIVGLLVFASHHEASPASPPAMRPVDRMGWLRYILFGAGSSLGLLAFVAFNYWRFGTLLTPGRYDAPELFGGNPIAGLLSLTLSPGKSVFLFSPPLALAFFGARALSKREPILAAVVGLVSVVHLLLVIQLAFFGGDWCWGPRYLLVLVPLWALSIPFALQHLRRWVVGAAVTLGLVVQLMGISVDSQRFFFEHNLPPYFWRDQWAYFKYSQLLSRPLELFSIVRAGVPLEAKSFSPTPGAQTTYTPAGPRNYGRDGALWVRHFAVFHTLRPWPFWIWVVDPARRPVEPGATLLLCGALFIGGVALLMLGLLHPSPSAALTEAVAPHSHGPAAHDRR
jgi:hypothetical protein